MLEFLNQGWVGTIVGTGGVALALILYWRSRISGIIAFQSRDVSMIGGDKAVFPAEVEVRYRGTLVPGLTSSTVWIWNAGKKTVRGVDIVAHDPLQLSFSGEVLNVKIRKVTRESVRITADAPQGAEATVRCGFEFLDPGDGGVLEVLHTGSDEAPECSGTVISLPKGPQYWGHAWGRLHSFHMERRSQTIAAGCGYWTRDRNECNGSPRKAGHRSSSIPRRITAHRPRLVSCADWAVLRFISGVYILDPTPSFTFIVSRDETWISLNIPDYEEDSSVLRIRSGFTTVTATAVQDFRARRHSPLGNAIDFHTAYREDGGAVG